MAGNKWIWAIAAFAFLFGGCATVREPAYKVVSVNDGYEVREYAGYLAAETTVSGPWKEGLRPIERW